MITFYWYEDMASNMNKNNVLEENMRLTAIIMGDVQNVGYRAFIRRHALDLHLCGYAENMSDGRVEVVVEGPESELKHLLKFLRTGPAHAVVKDVETDWATAGGLKNFYVY